MADTIYKHYYVQSNKIGTVEVKAATGNMAIRIVLRQLGKIDGAYKVVAGTAANHNFVVHEKEGRNEYFQVGLNREEIPNTDMHVLHQKWLKDMELINEYYNSQVFFDKKSRCVYVVTDTDCGIQINEVSPSNPDYTKFIG